MKQWKKALLIVTVSIVALLWYNPSALAQNVLAGVDLWETRPGDATFDFGGGFECPPIPADFFGPGSDPFEGQVAFQGEPLPTTPSGILGSADTIVERLGDAILPSCPSSDTVPIEIVALNLVSTAPITVTYFGGGEASQWDVRMCLSSETSQPIGSKTIDKDCDEGGTFIAIIPLIPKFIFTRVEPPHDQMIWDYGWSGDVVVYSVLDGFWLYDDPAFNVITSPGGVSVDHDCDGASDVDVGPGSNFFPGLQAVPCNCQSEPIDYTMVLTLWQSQGCGDHGVYPPQAQTQPTIEPQIATECPEIQTECPELPTWCPDNDPTVCQITECPDNDTFCPVEPTICPAMETECPVVETECPIYGDTYCPVVETQCPKFETFCPEEFTLCPMFEPTFCPYIDTECFQAPTWCPIDTFCPLAPTFCQPAPTFCEVLTECPDDPTRCPTIPLLTVCPLEPTVCPDIPTSCFPFEVTVCPYEFTFCPGDWTYCPFNDTYCPEDITYCPLIDTQCSAVETECPVNLTQCPTDPTNCPGGQTWCPEIPTECPVLHTFCPDANPTICEITNCPVETTLCPIEPTQCPLIDSDGDSVNDCNDNCITTPNPGQEDTYPPPSGNHCGDACECEGNFDDDQDQDGSDAAQFKLDFGRSPFSNPCTDSLPCNGDFDCDVDVDGSDAAKFKEDFGRSPFSNPCPYCPTDPWCNYTPLCDESGTTGCITRMECGGITCCCCTISGTCMSETNCLDMGGSCN